MKNSKKIARTKRKASRKSPPKTCHMGTKALADTPPPMEVRVESAVPDVKVGDMVRLKPCAKYGSKYAYQYNAIGEVKLLASSSVLVVPENAMLADEGCSAIVWDRDHIEPVTEYKPEPAQPTHPVLDATLPALYESLALCGGDERKFTDALIDSYKRIGDGLATGLDIAPDMAYGVPITALASFQASAVMYLKQIGYKAK